MNALATSLQTYFTAFARAQRDLSSNTIASYRDAWRMLLKHLTVTLDVPADRIDFDALTVTNVTGFLDHLEHDRGNNAKTRNTRLTAIRAVLSRALPDHPEHAATIHAGPRDPTQARGETGHRVPRPRRSRRAARSTRSPHMDQAARPGAADDDGANRASDQ